MNKSTIWFDVITDIMAIILFVITILVLTSIYDGYQFKPVFEFINSETVQYLIKTSKELLWKFQNL